MIAETKTSEPLCEYYSVCNCYDPNGCNNDNLGKCKENRDGSSPWRIYHFLFALNFGNNAKKADTVNAGELEKSVEKI